MNNANYSSENLERFLVMAAEKGLMNKNTAQAIRIAAGKVLGVLEDHERIDVREIDRERVFHRFQNLNGMKYSPESLATYRSRFGSALDEFIAYTTNPSVYKFQGRAGSSGNKNSTNKSLVRSQTKKVSSQKRVDVSSPQAQPSSGDSLMIPVPIRDGTLVRIFGIPADLTEDEAKKISAVIQAYASAG